MCPRRSRIRKRSRWSGFLVLQLVACNGRPSWRSSPRCLPNRRESKNQMAKSSATQSPRRKPARHQVQVAARRPIAPVVRIVVMRAFSSTDDAAEFTLRKQWEARCKGLAWSTRIKSIWRYGTASPPLARATIRLSRKASTTFACAALSWTKDGLLLDGHRRISTVNSLGASCSKTMR